MLPLLVTQDDIQGVLIVLFARKLLFAVLLAVVPLISVAGSVDINTASAEELSSSLNGIGPAKAAAIVAYRDENGPFQAVDDLIKVSGVGEKLVDSNRSNINVGNTGSGVQ